MRHLLPPTLVVVLLHVYLWRRLVRRTQLAPRWARTATIALCVLGGSLPCTLLMWWFVSRAASPALSAVAFGWVGVIIYLLSILLAWDLVLGAVGLAHSVRRWVQPTVNGSAPATTAEQDAAASSERETRRVFMARAAAGSALVAAGGIATFGVRSALWEITTPEIAVGLRRLPRALDGYSIALISDVHIGPMLDGRFLRQLAEQTNRMRPDLIAIVGDLVDGDVATLGSQVAELRRLRARDGVCFVTGNHEYYSGAGPWVAYLKQLGVRVLMNERISLGDADARGAQFDLAGIPDRRAQMVSAIGADVGAAVLGRDPERELVMLAHQPIQIVDTALVGTGLQLSGHTHGGQLYPFGEMARLAQPYLAGLYRHAPDTQIYVSRGTGFWGPPMRVLAPAEIALIRLHSV